MKSNYTVAVSYSAVDNSYSVTCRRLDASRHWKRTPGNPNCIYDSRDPARRTFTILFEAPEKEAKLFVEGLKMNYYYQGVTQVTVRFEADEEAVLKLFETGQLPL